MLRWLPFITLAVREIALERLVSLLVDGQDWLRIRKVAFMEHIWPLARGRMIFPMPHACLSFLLTLILPTWTAPKSEMTTCYRVKELLYLIIAVNDKRSGG